MIIKNFKYVLFLFSFSCASPSFFVTKHNILVSRYFSGPSSEEINKIEQLAIDSGLCKSEELSGINIKILPIKKLYGCSDYSGDVIGQADSNTITISGLFDFSCRVLLHELTHTCRRRRGINDFDHSDRTIWNVRKRLLPKYDAMVAAICP